jgi:hypothetical protein
LYDEEYLKLKLWGQVRWHTAVIAARQEMEVGESASKAGPEQKHKLLSEK